MKSSPKIKFDLTKSWVEDNNIKVSTITLLRYSGDSWSDLEASQTSSDSNKYYFEASTPEFSYFAITGVAKTAEEIAAEKAAAAKEKAGFDLPSILKGSRGIYWIFLIIGLIVILLVASLLYNKKKRRI